MYPHLRPHPCYTALWAKALDAETVNVTQTQTVCAAERSAWDSVLTAWMPQQFRGFLGPARSGDLALEVDREEQPGSLASAMDLLRDKVDNYFGWSKKCLDKSWLAKRGAAQALVKRNSKRSLTPAQSPCPLLTEGSDFAAVRASSHAAGHTIHSLSVQPEISSDNPSAKH